MAAGLTAAGRDDVDAHALVGGLTEVLHDDPRMLLACAVVPVALRLELPQLLWNAIAALIDDSAEEACVRAAAIDALGQVGDAESYAEAINEHLFDPDKSVRAAATSALKRWGAV